MTDGRNGRRLASIVVRSMEQLMSFVRIRLSQELVIKLFDHRIVVRLTNRTVFVGAFQNFPFSTPEQQDGGIEPPPVLASRFFRFLNLP